MPLAALPAVTVAGPAPVQSVLTVIAVWNGVVPMTSLQTCGALRTFTVALAVLEAPPSLVVVYVNSSVPANPVAGV